MKKKLLCLALFATFTLSACGTVSDDITVANVGDSKITKSEFEFYLTNVKQQLMGTELSSDADWETKDIDGKKAIEVAKEKALASASQNIAYIKIYEKLGNKIGDSEKKEIQQKKDSIVQQYDKNGGYQSFLDNAKISDEFIDMLCKSMICSEKLYNDFSANEAVSDDEISSYYDEHYDEYYAGQRRAKHVLILTQNADTQEKFSDEKKKEAKKKADDIYKRALNGEDFDSLVSQYSEDPGSKSNPDGYTFGDGEMVKEFQDCVDSLEFNQIGFVESDFGYHIIKRLEIDKSYFSEDIKQRILGERFNDYIEEKMNEFGLTVEEKDAINESLGKKKADE